MVKDIEHESWKNCHHSPNVCHPSHPTSFWIPLPRTPNTTLKLRSNGCKPSSYHNLPFERTCYSQLACPHREKPHMFSSSRSVVKGVYKVSFYWDKFTTRQILVSSVLSQNQTKWSLSWLFKNMETIKLIQPMQSWKDSSCCQAR